MEWWVVLLLAIAVAIGLLLVPLNLNFSLEARGEPSGFWAVAGGLQCGPLSVTGVVASEVKARSELRVFGRRVKTLHSKAEGKELASKAAAGYRSANERFDLLSWAVWVLGEQKRLRLLRLDLTLTYSFANVMLTGQLLAATSMLSGVLPAPVRIISQPSWELVDKASAALDARIRIWPGLFLLDALRFRLKNRTLSGERA